MMEICASQTRPNRSHSPHQQSGVRAAIDCVILVVDRITIPFHSENPLRATYLPASDAHVSLLVLPGGPDDGSQCSFRVCCFQSKH